MSLFGNLFGDNGASDTQRQAMHELEGLDVPTVESQQVQLQKLVEAGVITPEQAQAALVNGNALDNVSADNQGMSSELQALGQLGSIAKNGGRDAQEEADLQGVLDKMNASERGANDAALQEQAQRGALTSGESLAAKLLSNQNQASNANANALNANAAAQSRTMQALQSLGSLGGNVQGQQATADTNKANAANAIAQFNAQQQQQTNLANTNAKNNAQQLNLANKQDISNQNVNNANNNAIRNSNLVQQKFNNDVTKATGVANQGNQLAQTQQNQANQNAAFIGNLIGTGGQVGAAYMGAAHGAVVPGHAEVPGDSPKNDKVPAMLSPGEVVLPRSVVQHPDPASISAFLQRMRKPEPSVHPKDVATVLSALSHVRNSNG